MKIYKAAAISDSRCGRRRRAGTTTSRMSRSTRSSTSGARVGLVPSQMAHSEEREEQGSAASTARKATPPCPSIWRRPDSARRFADPGAEATQLHFTLEVNNISKKSQPDWPLGQASGSSNLARDMAGAFSSEAVMGSTSDFKIELPGGTTMDSHKVHLGCQVRGLQGHV
jgi:hypothetical protein